MWPPRGSGRKARLERRQERRQSSGFARFVGFETGIGFSQKRYYALRTTGFEPRASVPRVVQVCGDLLSPDKSEMLSKIAPSFALKADIFSAACISEYHAIHNSCDRTGCGWTGAEDRLRPTRVARKRIIRFCAESISVSKPTNLAKAAALSPLLSPL